ncbi:MAG: DDE-type integrase/transposase/recombinase [Marinomonas sp.]
MAAIHPNALFRLSVLGPLASRDTFSKGELTQIIQSLAEKTYDIPGSRRVHISASTIERWYRQWKRNGIDGLVPKPRNDVGQSRLSPELQATLLQAKRENPSRSINSLIRFLELKGTVGKGRLSRSSVHRLLKSNQLSARIIASPETIERRRFVAKYSGDIWQGDVMHGPSFAVNGKYCKTYLVTFMDDASRLITHSEFRLGETALDVQAVLKQALLKRGVPKRIIVDNGSGYRCGSLQAICARLSIQLVFCKPYEPAAKGKIEKWHSTFRSQFMSEIELAQMEGLTDLNSRLWAYLEQIYHQNPHSGLEQKMTPLERWRKDIPHIKLLGRMASQLDELFYHREKRRVRKDGCVSLNKCLYEVPYELTGQSVMLVFDPLIDEAKWVESEDGKRLGEVTVCDPIHNLHRKRQRTQPMANVADVEGAGTIKKSLGNIIELNHDNYKENLAIHTQTNHTKEEKK